MYSLKIGKMFVQSYSRQAQLPADQQILSPRSLNQLKGQYSQYTSDKDEMLPEIIKLPNRVCTPQLGP